MEHTNIYRPVNSQLGKYLPLFTYTEVNRPQGNMGNFLGTLPISVMVAPVGHSYLRNGE